MLRGRREYCIILVFCFLFLHLHFPVQAIELKMTANVPLSPFWQKTIEENTRISVDATSHQNLIVSSVRLNQIENAVLKEQTIQGLFFYDNQLIATEEKTMKRAEKYDFLFVYHKPGNYRILFINKTYEHPFSLQSILFSL